MKQKYYAVRKGRQPGIYLDWESCKKQVEGFAGAQYKSFSTKDEAAQYMSGQAPTTAVPGKKVSSATSNSQRIPEGHVVIYADGACSGNPGKGGYGAVVLRSDQRQELSAGFRRTTNNRMEILGCIAGLDAVEERSDVILYSDSRYVVDASTKGWAQTWRSRGWNRKVEGELVPALNSDLWARLLDLCEWHRVQFRWVRGHDGNVENERCDELARAAAASDDLQPDTGYEK